MNTTSSCNAPSTSVGSFTVDNGDSTPPAFASGSPAASGITISSFTLSSTINEVGKTYYVVLPGTATDPTSAQVKAGQDASGMAVALSGSVTNPTANTAATVSVTGLASSTTYKVYVVAEDGIPNLQAAPTLLTVTTLTPTPVPTITGFSPLNGVVGTSVTITGTDFTGATAVRFNGTAVASFTVVDASTITTTVPAGATTGAITVVTPGGTATSPTSFTVDNPVPTVTTLNPSTKVAGSPGFTLTVSGSNFINGSTVNFAGSARTTTFVSANSLTAAILAPDVAAAGTYPVTVVTPTPGGGTSNSVDLTVTAPPASLTADKTTLEGFSTNTGTASTEQQYMLTAANLTAPLTVTAPSGYEVSLTSGTGFAGTITAPATGGIIYVRIGATAPTGAATGTITNVSGAKSVDVAVSGFVYPAGTTSCIATEGFEGTTFPPTGWLATSVTRSTTTTDVKVGSAAANFGANTGTLTMPVLSYPVAVSFYLGRTTNTTAKTLVVEVSTTGQAASDFVTVATYDHTNVPVSSYNQYSVDLSAYSANAQVWVRFRKVSTTTAAWRLDEVKSYCGPAPMAAEINIKSPANADILSGGTYDFGAVLTPTATAQFTIQNTGTADLTLSGTPAVQLLSGSSPDFTISAQPATSTITGGSSTTFTVTYTPSGTASQTATLSIANNDATGNENPYLISLTGTTSVSYVWNGTGTSWDAAASWTPTRTTPDALDVLIFDGTTTPTALVTTDFVSPQTVAQLLFRNNVAATFSNTGTRTLNIANGNTSRADLVVGAGSSLNVTNPTTTTGLVLQLVSGGTASISGTVVFDNGAHRLQATAASSIEFLSGSSFKAGVAMSGSPFGSVTANATSVVFRNGSRLEQMGGSQPFGLTAPGTVLTLEPTSQYIYSIPTTGSVPPLSSRTYGNLEFNVGTGINTTSSAGGTLTIAGDLTVTSGNVSLNLTNTISVAGSIAVNGSSTLTFNPSSAATVALNGSATQTIGGTAGPAALTLGTNSTLQVANAQGVKLARPLTLNRLQLTNGVFTTDAANLLTLLSSATLSGGSSTSFINGPLARITAPTAATVLFPVGAGSNYRPLTLTISTQTSTTTYTATQHDAAFPDRRLTGDLTRISRVRYFTVAPDVQPTGFTGTVSLSFDTDDQVSDPTLPSLVVAKNDGNGWVNIGHTGASVTTPGAFVAGTLTSGTFTSFSDFALASTDPDIVQNPLPVELTSFTASRQAQGIVLKWATASEKNNDHFDVLRSTDGKTFTVLTSVAGQGQSNRAHSYTALDQKPLATPMAYYRLRQIDFDGKATLSPVVVVRTTTELQLFPNPVQNVLTIRGMESEAGTTPVTITDLAGRVVLRGKVAADGQLDVRALSAGTYLVYIGEGTTRVTRKVVKE